MATRDLKRSKEHYERLGFTFNVFGDDFAMAEREGVTLHFAVNPEHDPEKTASWIYIRCEDADALYQEWKAAGVRRLREPHDTDYKMREGHHIDPEGNLVNFGSRLLGG
ncbi:MAG TPA: VOC family protein [Nitrososphaerales archaeon]|nr:VOC family protein [Nitrososphaerales archaeon]HUK74506.1 VOC family protein [Nitrososphaerales archaeon]